MTLTGKGGFPLRSVWVRVSSLYRPIIWSVANADLKTIMVDWFFPPEEETPPPPPPIQSRAFMTTRTKFWGV